MVATIRDVLVGHSAHREDLVDAAIADAHPPRLTADIVNDVVTAALLASAQNIVAMRKAMTAQVVAEMAALVHETPLGLAPITVAETAVHRGKTAE